MSVARRGREGPGCGECRRLLSRRLDGVADAGLREDIAAHLAACADCRGFLAACRDLEARFGRALGPRGGGGDGGDSDSRNDASGRAGGELEALLSRSLAAARAAPPPVRVWPWRPALAGAASIAFGFALWMVVAPWIAPARSGEDLAERPRPAPPAGGVILVEERRDSEELVPGLDGPPRVWSTRSERAVMSEAPAGERPDGDALILELERLERRPVRPVSSGWH